MYSLKIFLLIIIFNFTLSKELIPCKNKTCNCIPVFRDHIKRKYIRCGSMSEYGVFNIWIEYKSFELLEVKCNSEAINIDKYEFNFGKVKPVSFTNCRLTTGVSIFEKWNLTDAKELKLKKMFDVNDQGVMKKDFFGNISKSSFQKLYIESCGVQVIEDDVFQGFDNLTTLTFRNNFLKEIPDIFKYVRKLQQLNLYKNNINKFPSTITLSNLEILNLNNNYITDLDENMFLKVPNITSLELSANPIKTLSQNVLRPLKKLNSVNIGLEGNVNITDLFMENKMLTTIRLRGGKISFISPNAFKNLVDLKIVNICESKLTYLPKDLFKNNLKIERIILSENHLTTLPNGIFGGLKKLKTIDLSENKLAEWKYEFYGTKLPMLEEIVLNNNNLEAIGNSAFINLYNLESLSLNNNKIRSFDNKAFDTMRQRIRKLVLSNNNLNDIQEESFRYLMQLEYLNLDNNSYTMFPNAIHSVLGNFAISLKFNKIEHLEIRNLSFLPNVDLTGNLIRKVDFYFFEEMNGKPRELTLNDNPISCDCSAYDLFKYTKIDNRKLRIKDDILKCSHPPELKSKFIREVAMKDLKCTFKSGTIEYKYICPEKCICSLYPFNATFHIDCSGLGLDKPPTIDLLTQKLIEGVTYNNFYVDLSRNNIKEFTKMGNYSNVTGLDLSENNLYVINWIPQYLRILKLNSNKLSSIKYNVLEILKDSLSLESLRLDDNQWNCDCALNNLTYAVRITFRHFLKNVNKILCSDGRLLIHQTKTQLCKKKDVFVIVLISLTTFFVMAIVIFSIVYFKYETTVKIWLYSNSILTKCVTEQDFDKDKIYDAFISYSHKDETFLLDHLLPELEGGSEPYKLCYHERDWEVGEFINRQIVDSVSNSRRTIIVLSKNFLESSWGAIEFRTAYTQAMNEKLNRLIVILYDDITPNEVLDEELKIYLKTTSYIKWGDPWFWKKLRYALSR